MELRFRDWPQQQFEYPIEIVRPTNLCCCHTDGKGDGKDGKAGKNGKGDKSKKPKSGKGGDRHDKMVKGDSHDKNIKSRALFENFFY